MKDGKIKESQLLSSSYMKTQLNKTGNCPHFSRPGSIGVFTVEDGMLHYDRNNFLQVDFRTKTKVEMVMKSKVTLEQSVCASTDVNCISYLFFESNCNFSDNFKFIMFEILDVTF